MKIELGWKVKDIITDFEGIVCGIVYYLTGCHQALVSPKVDNEGKRHNGEWFDIQRLERVGNCQVVVDNNQYNGCDISPGAGRSDVSPNVM